MTTPITNIKNKDSFWHLKELARTVEDIWNYNISILDDESDAEYKLAIAKSKRMQDDISELVDLDLDLNWGCEKEYRPGSTWNIKKTGDFNPWYDGDLTLDELLQALEGLYMFSLSSVEPEEYEIRLMAHYEFLKNFLESNKKINNNKTVYGDLIFWDSIHPEIKKVSESRFNAGHYADSVEASLKYINSKIKKVVHHKTAIELDGSDLMNRAFSAKNPVITLGDLETESGRNIQVGFMQIFSGSMTGIRNPKAHDNINITRDRAVHFLFLASLLLKTLEQGEVIE